jgi:hypothetical protein
VVWYTDPEVAKTHGDITHIRMKATFSGGIATKAQSMSMFPEVEIMDQEE